MRGEKVVLVEFTNVIYFQIDYPNLKSGNAALNASYIWGLIYFPSNYTLALKNRINLLLSLTRYDADASSVQVTLDPTSKCEYT